MKVNYKNPVLYILIGGVVFSWYTVITDFIRFKTIYGTIFRVENCLVPNPVTTPCFYGALAFFVALILLINRNLVFLKYLLVGGTVFAWSNFFYEAFKYYQPSNFNKIGCSGIEIVSLYNTPCFYGAVIYLLALIFFWIINKK